MRKFFKIGIWGLIMVVAGSVLSGCNQKEEKQPPAIITPEISEPVVEPIKDQQKIRVITQFGEGHPFAATYKQKLEKFKQEHPNVEILDQSTVPNELWKATIVADFMAGNEPDVICTYTGKDADIMIKENKVVSINEIRKQYPDYPYRYEEKILDIIKNKDGNTYAVPQRGIYQGFFVNQKIFTQYNIEIPSDWEKLNEAIVLLKENGKIPIAAGLTSQPEYWIDHLILSQAGVEGHRNQDVQSVKENWIKGLSLLKGLYEIGAFPEDTFAISDEYVVDLFEKEQAAMLLTSSEKIAQLVNQEDIIEIPFPIAPGGRKQINDRIIHFDCGWYITQKAWEDSEKRSVMVDFIQTMVGDEKVVNLKDEIGGASIPIKEWMSEPAWNNLVNKIPFVATGKESEVDVVNEVISIR